MIKYKKMTGKEKRELALKNIRLREYGYDSLTDLNRMVKLYIDGHNEAEQQINLSLGNVSKQRELLIAFKTWEVDNDIKNLLPEQLADFYLDESN